MHMFVLPAATLQGGAVHLKDAAKVDIQQCLFTANKAGFGGAVHLIGPITGEQCIQM
jgi:hypothetical protein